MLTNLKFPDDLYILSVCHSDISRIHILCSTRGI